MGETALVTTSRKKPQPPCKPAYKRLTNEDRVLACQLRDKGQTQAQIAQALGCTQQAVSGWLTKTTDSTASATLFFRGQALPMAEKIVKTGRASDLIKALQGVGVLQEERGGGLVVQIGIKDSDVSISLSPPSIPGAERKPSESLVISAGSDKPPYVT